MINRTLLLLTIIASTTVASEFSHMNLEENMNTDFGSSKYSHAESESLAQNTRLLTQVLLQAANLHKINTAGNDLEEKFIQKNGSSAFFSADESNRKAGQEIVDQVVDKNLPDQPVQHSSITKKVARRINTKIRKHFRAKL